DKYLAHIAPVVRQIRGSQKIQPPGRMGVQVEPKHAGTGQRGFFLLDNLSAGGHQLEEESPRLVTVELHLQAVGGRVREGLIADVGGSARRIIDEYRRDGHSSRSIRFDDPE